MEVIFTERPSKLRPELFQLASDLTLLVPTLDMMCLACEMRDETAKRLNLKRITVTLTADSRLFQSFFRGREIIPRSKRAVFLGLDTEASSQAK